MYNAKWRLQFDFCEHITSANKKGREQFNQFGVYSTNTWESSFENLSQNWGLVFVTTTPDIIALSELVNYVFLAYQLRFCFFFFFQIPYSILVSFSSSSFLSSLSLEEDEVNGRWNNLQVYEIIDIVSFFYNIEFYFLIKQFPYICFFLILRAIIN